MLKRTNVPQTQETFELQRLARNEVNILNSMLKKSLFKEAENYFYSLPSKIFDMLNVKHAERIQTSIDTYNLQQYQQFAIKNNWAFKSTGIEERFTPKEYSNG